MNKTGQSLTPKQQKAMALLLTEPTTDGAAKLAGVSRTTLYEWLKDAQFKAALDESRAALFADSLSTLKSAMREGVEALRSVLKDKDATTTQKITAAVKLIELALRSHEQLDIETRLSALEAQNNERQTKTFQA